MADETANLPETPSTTIDLSAQIAGVGRKQSFAFNSAPNNENTPVIVAEANVEEPLPQQTEEVKQDAAEVSAPTPEQLKAYFKSLNIDFDGNAETLKEKLAPRVAEPTAEEKEAARLAEEKAMLDLFLENGGTIDQFSAWKSIKDLPVEELSKSAALREMMEIGLSKEEAEAELANRYYLNDLSELENLNRDDFDTEEEFAAEKAKIQKKVDFGAKKLAAKGLPIKQQAEQFFNGLGEAIKAKEAQKQQEVTYSSKVDEHFTKMPREITLELGERNGQKIDPIQYRVPDAVIEQTKEVLRDPAKRKQFFFNQDDTLNIENIAKLMVGYNALQHASKLSFIEGQHRNTQEFEKIFPARTAYQAANFGTQPNADDKGGIVKKGPVQRVGYQQIHKR